MSQDNVGYCPALAGAKEVKGDFLDTLGKGTQPSSRALHCPWQPHTSGGNTHFKPAQAQGSSPEPCPGHPAVPGGSLELSPLQKDVVMLRAEVSPAPLTRHAGAV